MEIRKIDNAVCDIEGCARLAFRQISYDKNSKSGFNICQKCLMEIYDEMAKVVCERGLKNEKRR